MQLFFTIRIPAFDTVLFCSDEGEREREREREREIYGTKVSGSEGIIRDDKLTILTRERENFKTKSRS